MTTDFHSKMFATKMISDYNSKLNTTKINSDYSTVNQSISKINTITNQNNVTLPKISQIEVKKKAKINIRSKSTMGQF